MDKKKYEQIIALGIFLRAHIIVCRDKLNRLAIKNIEDNYYFSQAAIYERLHSEQYQEILNHAAQLISQSGCADEAFSIYAEEYMKSFSKEKRQKQGAVYTPQEIVDWIHTKLIEQSPLSLHKTYCDFACGTGHFVLDWYKRLVDHWRQSRDQYPEIRDEHEAHRWIVEKCLCFADIDPFAIRMCKMGLFLKDPEVVGLKFNSCVGDSLLIDPFGLKEGDERRVGVRKDERYVEIFDYVAGNPPWNTGKAGANTDIYDKFLYLAMSRGNVVGFVTSGTFIWSGKKKFGALRSALQKFGICRIQEVNRKHFGIVVDCEPVNVILKKDSRGAFTFKKINGSSETIILRDTPHIDMEPQLLSVVSKLPKQYLLTKRGRTRQLSKKDIPSQNGIGNISRTQTTSFQYKTMNRVSDGSGSAEWVWSDTQVDDDLHNVRVVWGIISTGNGLGPIHIVDPEVQLTQMCCYVVVANMEEARHLQQYLRSNLFKTILNRFRVNTTNSVGVLRRIPCPDLSRPCNDQDLYRDYKLLEEEIKIIEE